MLVLLFAACSRDDARHGAAPREPAVTATGRAAGPPEVAADATARVQRAKAGFLTVEPRLWHRTGALGAADLATLEQAVRELDAAAGELSALPAPPPATIRQLTSAAGDLTRVQGPVDGGHGPDEYSYSIADARKHLDFALEYIEIWKRAGYH